VWHFAQRSAEMNISAGMNLPLAVVAFEGEKGFAPNLKS
jgi:hypothetical protein